MTTEALATFTRTAAACVRANDLARLLADYSSVPSVGVAA